MTTRFLGLNRPSQQLRNKNTTGGPDGKPSRPKLAALSVRFHTHRPLARELRVTPAFHSHSQMLRDFSFREAWFRELWFRELCPRSTATSAAPRSASCAHRTPG